MAESCALLQEALNFRSYQGAVTVQFGSDRVRVMRALRRSGEPLDPMASHDAIERLIEVFTAAGWDVVGAIRDEVEDEYISASLFARESA